MKQGLRLVKVSDWDGFLEFDQMVVRPFSAGCAVGMQVESDNGNLRGGGRKNADAAADPQQ